MTRWAGDLLVLCYHAVSPTWDADLSVTPQALEWQLSRLVRRGYRGATFADATHSGEPRGRTLVVTFDDAFESVHRLARPILARLGIPATVFVPTHQALRDEPMSWPGVDQWLDGPHAGELHGMSSEQLRELAADGWELGAHTRTHACLPDLPDEQLEAELSGSKEDVERELGVSCRTAAYPYGAADDRVCATARAAGFEAAAGLSSDLRRASRFYWPRVGIYHEDGRGRFGLKISRAVRLARSRQTLAGLLRRTPIEEVT